MNEYPHDSVVPFISSTEGKKDQIKEMFDRIAFRYDFLNHFLSLGNDTSWRRKALKILTPDKPANILDVATGTGDFAIMAANILKPSKIVGIDISEGMLDIGREKVKGAGLQSMIEMKSGDSEAISFGDNSFDAVIVAFGVRNFENLDKGLNEIKRVLKPEKKLVIVEATKPSSALINWFYRIYMKCVTTPMGRWFSKDKEAYKYLNNSVRYFPEKKDFIHILNQLGYRNAFYKSMTLGTCTIYCAEK